MTNFQLGTIDAAIAIGCMVVFTAFATSFLAGCLAVLAIIFLVLAVLHLVQTLKYRKTNERP